MEIRAKCECGKTFRVARRHAGKRGRCPKCGSIVQVPLPELTADDVLDDPVAGDALPADGNLTRAGTPAASDLGDLLDDRIPQTPSAAATIACPSCKASLPAGRTVCGRCGFHRETGQRLASITQARERVRRDPPEGVSVEENEAGLMVTARTMSQGGGLAVYYLIVIPLLFLFFGVLIAGFSLGSELLPRIGGGLLMIGILGAVGYSLAAAFINRTVLRVDGNEISIRHLPLPTLTFRNRMPVADVAQLYVVEKRRMKRLTTGIGSVTDAASAALNAYDVNKTGLFSYSYDLNVALNNGWRRRLLTFADRESAEFIERKLERFLGVDQAPVVSTWYQKLFLQETTRDDEWEEEPAGAISAQSLPLPAGVLVPACAMLLVMGCCVLSPVLRLFVSLGTRPATSRGQSVQRLQGKPAPAMAVPLLDGGTFRVPYDLEQRVVLLDFWASWCPPCRQEMRMLEGLAEQYRERGVVVYAVNQRESAGKIRNFFRSSGDSSPVTVAQDSSGQAGRAYGVRALPTLVVIDRRGLVHSVHTGYSPRLESQLRTELDELTSSPTEMDTSSLDSEHVRESLVSHVRRGPLYSCLVISRRNQARAKVHNRLLVRGEIPSVSDASSIVMPQKNRSLTSSAARSSTWASLSSPSSRSLG